MSPKTSNDSAVTAASETTGNTARDGDIAVREEFDRAAEINTVAAWELFLARHPGHPLAEEATSRLRVARAAEN